MITIRIRPDFEEDFTILYLNGEHEDSMLNVVASSFINRGDTVEILDSDGEWIDITEFTYE